MVEQEGDVLPALPERGQAKGDDGKAVIEVLAELALPDHGLEVAVGGADEPQVERDGLVGAEPLDGARLEES